MRTLRNEKVFSKVLTSLKPYLSTVHYQMLSYLTTSHYHRLYDNDDNLLLIHFYTIHLHQLAARVSRLLRSIFSDRLPCNFQKMNYFSCFKRIGMFSLSLQFEPLLQLVLFSYLPKIRQLNRTKQGRELFTLGDLVGQQHEYNTECCL